MEYVRSWLDRADVSEMFTHRLDVSEAPKAYRLLDERKDEAVQVVFTYD